MQLAEKVNILGVGLSALNLSLARELILAAVAEHRKGYVCVTGVHGVTEAQEDEDFRRILNAAFLNTPDGMPMVWLGRFFGHGEMSRVYGPDLMLEMCEATAGTDVSHFFYGGAPGCAEELRDALQNRFPGLTVAGTFTPPFRPLNDSEEVDLKEMFERLQPDITWIGLSTPKQEKFMAQYLERLNTTIMIGVGAAFDFHAGRVRQAPRWIQRSGFEWFYRLCQEPRRLWKRYLRNNPVFVGRVILQLTGMRKYRIES